jgi:hypothetical protein
MSRYWTTVVTNAVSMDIATVSSNKTDHSPLIRTKELRSEYWPIAYVHSNTTD